MTDIDTHAAQLIKHPHFETAFAEFCQRLTANYADPRLQNLAFADMQRWALAMMILFLGGIPPRQERLGATVADLVSFCAQGGYGSRKLVREAIAVFIDKALVTERDVPADKRKIAIFASDKLIRIFEADVMARLSVLDIVSDKPLLLADYSNSSHVLMKFVDGHVGAFIADQSRITDRFPEVQHFLGYTHGYVIFLHIIGAARRQQDGRIVAPLSQAGIAANLAVSRTHVAKLIKATIAQGWLLQDARRRDLQLSTPFFDRARLWVAHELAMLKHSLNG
jgi:hypothetical protein